MNYIFEKTTITKAINIGISGCGDTSIKIGTLFCTNKLLPKINFASLTTIDEPLLSDEDLETLLVDMEAKYFKEISSKYTKNIYIFKVVSDYLDMITPNESFIEELIENSFDKWKEYI